MDPLTLALLGGGLGIIQGREKQQQEQKDRELAAQTQKYSPWTHLQAQPVQRAPSLLNSGLQGGLGGASFGQSLTNNTNDQKFKDAQINYLNNQSGAGQSPMQVVQAQPQGAYNPDGSLRRTSAWTSLYGQQ